MKQFFLFLAVSYQLTAISLSAQTNNTNVADSILSKLHWRNIGPFRGGRSLAVAGHADQPQTFYFGATGGGVWKSTNSGMNWACISDTTFKSSSVGCIAVAPSDANIVYVGMGETEIRGNLSFGDGIYKSTDAGKTWRAVGLKKSGAIGRIVVHPKNPDIALVTALGNPYGRVVKNADAEERGVYRTTDGGTSWQRVLSPTNDKTGAIDVAMDPNNSSVLYASLWECYRNNFTMSSGGEGSGMYKSTDGGTTWKNISKNPGLPVGTLGKIEIAVSYFDGKRVWAMVENKNGGLFRSDDSGETWSRINNDKNLWQRPWYYMEIAADPATNDGLYVMNVNTQNTTDGGKTFNVVKVHHGDTHDIWINPKNPDILIIGDDGGAEVSINRGGTFTDLDIPTCQFYHLSVDNEFPYHLYGAQQDNSSIRIKSRNLESGAIDRQDWDALHSGESGYVVSDPTNADIVYGGSYMGDIQKMTLSKDVTQNISPNPITYLGAGANDMKYRFQWTYPIVFSPHDPKTMFVTSQYVHKTTNGGQSWDIISPDLSRSDTNTIKSSGGEITKDNTGAETFADIFTFAESPVKPGIFWAGSDDGLLHVSTDDGKNWTKLSVAGLGDWSLMSIIEAGHFDAGTAYLAANRYKLDDPKPYLFKTKDFGKTWTKIVTGLPDNAYCRVIREDPKHKGLLYAGTEIGVFVSFDDGAYWHALKSNLPLTPVHDIQVQTRENDLCIATHGRAFWILDNLAPVYQIMENQNAVTQNSAFLFQPEDSYRVNGGSFALSPSAEVGENAPNGVIFNYFLKEKPKNEILLRILKANKTDTVTTYSSVKDKKGKAVEINKDFYQKDKIERPGILNAQSGFNTFVWDMRYADATDLDGTPALMWAGSVVGPKIAPGDYVAQLILGKDVVQTVNFKILKDPRTETSIADLEENTALQLKVRDKLSEVHKAVNDLRKVRQQTNDYLGTVKDTVFKKEVELITKPMLEKLQHIEDELVQHKAKAPQDLLALPIRLNDKLAGIAGYVSSGETKPAKQAYIAYNETAPLIDKEIAALKKIMEEDVPRLNAVSASKKTSVIFVN